MDNTARKPTLKDVAALSGVSVISASRVMRDAPNISHQLRQKVEQAAYQEKVAEIKSNHRKTVIDGNLQDKESPIPGITNNQLLQNDARFNEWAVNTALFPESNISSARSDYESHMLAIRTSAPIKSLEAQPGVGRINDQTLQNVQPFLTKNSNG